MINTFDKRIVTFIGFVFLAVLIAGYLQYSDTQNKKVALLAEIKKTEYLELDKQKISDIELIITALNLALKYEGAYPRNISRLASYIELPAPINNNPYLYELCSDGSIHLGVRLEDETNPLLGKDSDEDPCNPNDFSGADPVYDKKLKP